MSYRLTDDRSRVSTQSPASLRWIMPARIQIGEIALDEIVAEERFAIAQRFAVQTGAVALRGGEMGEHAHRPRNSSPAGKRRARGR